MLGWAIAFLIIALVAALFGFGGIATASAGIGADPVFHLHRPFRSSRLWRAPCGASRPGSGAGPDKAKRRPR